MPSQKPSESVVPSASPYPTISSQPSQTPSVSFQPSISVEPSPSLVDVVDDDDFVPLEDGLRVLRWKFFGAFCFSTAGLIVSLILVMAHFDTVLFPQFWRSVFHDGSVRERNLLIALALFWTAALHVNTSSFSVGSVQGNVFFTTWTAFLACLLNYDVWRTGADLQSVSEYLQASRRLASSTTYNWFYTSAYALVVSSAIVDLYLYNDLQEFIDNDEQSILSDQGEWTRAISICWGMFGVSLLSIYASIKWGQDQPIRFCCDAVTSWRYVEGLILVGFVGGSGWISIEYTGVQGPIQAPSNAYFGVWGLFFSSLITFGSWMRQTNVDNSAQRPTNTSNRSIKQ